MLVDSHHVRGTGIFSAAAGGASRAAVYAVQIAHDGCHGRRQWTGFDAGRGHARYDDRETAAEGKAGRAAAVLQRAARRDEPGRAAAQAPAVCGGNGSIVPAGDHRICDAVVPRGGAAVEGSGAGGPGEFLREENQAAECAGGRSIYEEGVVYVGRGAFVEHVDFPALAFAGPYAEKVARGRGFP